MIDLKQKDFELKVNLDVGLSSDEVLEKVELGQTNKISKGSSKTIPSIIFSNIFTFFNIIIFLR